MKTISAFILALVLSAPLPARQRIQRVVPILSEQQFLLNGGFNASLQNGRSRQIFRIQLPPNTVTWYYTFSTYRDGDNGRPQLALAAQLARLIDRSGLGALAVSALFVPPGSAYAHVYLMDGPNADVFINKGDLHNQTLRVFRDCSRENFKNGTVDISDPTQGVWYIGVKNPSSTSAINVGLEVAAVVEEY